MPNTHPRTRCCLQGTAKQAVQEVTGQLESSGHLSLVGFVVDFGLVCGGGCC